MDKYLSPAMPQNKPRTRKQDSKMAAAAAPLAATEHVEQGDRDSGAEESADYPLCTQQSTSFPPAPAAEQPITYAVVVRAVQEAMAPIMKAHAASLQKAVSDLKGELTHLAQAVSTNEGRLGELFQDTTELKQKYESLQKSYFQLNNKVDDLENRSRRCNLRVLGIPESVKGPELFTFLQSTLPELLHIKELCANMVVERAHRLGPLRSTQEGRPRVVIFKSLSFVHKEAIWAASRKCKDIRWNGARLLIFQDYSSEVTRARKEFAVICSRLIAEGRKFALLYPARLRLFLGSGFKDFNVVADAEGFLQELQDEENGARSENSDAVK